MVFLLDALSGIPARRAEPCVCVNVCASCSPSQSPCVTGSGLGWFVLTVCKTCWSVFSLLVTLIPCIDNGSLSPRCCYCFPGHRGYCQRPDFVLLMYLLWIVFCLRFLHDKRLLSWPPLTKWAAFSMTAGLRNKLPSRRMLKILPLHLLRGRKVQM